MIAVRRIFRLSIHHLVALAAAVLALACVHAQAQGFQVKPMKMDMVVPVGKVSETTLELANTTTENLSLDVKLVELTQDKTGSWQILRDDASNDKDRATAVSWVSLERNRVDMSPSTTETVRIRFTPPPNARGSYVAGIIAEQPAQPDATGLVVRIRFLIPVILQIEGRPARQQIELADLTMAYRAGEGALAATTLSTLGIANNGRTYSKLRGEVHVSRKVEDNWRLVTRYQIQERSIIPGAAFEIETDLARRLPSGTYRLRAEIYVDGRRIRPLDKELDHQGDPAVDTAAYDTTLVLQPAIVEMSAAPGATRTATVSIENPSPTPVEVRVSIATPKGLQNVMMGGLEGSKLSAAPWTEVRPAEFTLRGNGRQNVRVITRYPREGVDQANYYGDVILEGRYTDGQSAGVTQSVIHLSNPKVESKTEGVLDRLLLAEGIEPSQYVVQTRLVNSGSTHVLPEVKASVLAGRGAVIAISPLEGELGPLLPLGVRDYSAAIDFSTVDEGTYALRVVAADKGDELVRRQVMVKVEIGEASKRVISVLEQTDFPEQADDGELAAKPDPAEKPK